MTKILLVGPNGRMGRAIKDCVAKSNEYEITRELDSKSWKNAVEEKAKVDVIIDFSLPAALNDVVKLVESHNVPLVSGVTGYSQAQLQQIGKLSQKVPILHSHNMSPGIAWLRRVLSQVPIEWKTQAHLIDIHHKEKRDTPSGTAKTLAEDLGVSIEQISSIRSGSAIGLHSVIFSLPDEELVIEHRALSRNLFARGALQASLWIQNKRPGLYSMVDMFS
ncbi:MAG: hypothetical protein COT74_04380 [Bdellovibrionales bacterium CG10_big_fil_rev_8_21_14_0_10_45_34]|nr:MAG: hypothetical protein COT74_04380 [Bdellovibrionales bacterium CG10_big_fil_rev_8_21_14_0_10_45_34]